MKMIAMIKMTTMAMKLTNTTEMITAFVFVTPTWSWPWPSLRWSGTETVVEDVE